MASEKFFTCRSLILQLSADVLKNACEIFIGKLFRNRTAHEVRRQKIEKLRQLRAVLKIWIFGYAVKVASERDYVLSADVYNMAYMF